MNVLSLFDGMSCGQLALNRAGIKYDNYYASEIKKFAIELTKHHYPNTIHVGDVCKLNAKDLPKIDLLIGGSPCQDFSNAKVNRKGLEGDKSRLFYEYLRLLKECKPKYFFLENVKMKDFSKNQLDNYLGVSGILINSSLVSYQTRARYYWTNIPNVTIPQNKNISFQDFKETNYNIIKKYKLNKTLTHLEMWNNGNGRTPTELNKNETRKSCFNVTNAKKVGCLSRKQDRSPNAGLVEFEDFCRFLTREELEQAQTVPIGYTKTLSYLQAQDVLGDGWTIDVIAHIFKNINKKVNKDIHKEYYQQILI
tara:strand:+ start:58 stop:984 length:927 start_codon:yes stop_codon:yes gene_type:complete